MELRWTCPEDEWQQVSENETDWIPRHHKRNSLWATGWELSKFQ